jgi:ABC-type glycerol-3-phosphate transport system substrate-binding protein
MLQGKCMALNDYTGTAVTEIDNPSNSKVVGQINLANTPMQVKHGPAIGTFICGIASGSANTEGAMKFLEWFTSDRIQTQFARQGGNAAVTSAALHDSQAVAKYRWLPAIAQSVDASTPKPRTPDEPKFEDILGTQLNLALLDALQQKGNYQKIAQKWLKAADDQMTKVLEQNKNIYF